MSTQGDTPEQWQAYLELYSELDQELRRQCWFVDGWRTEHRFVPAGNRVIFVLTKDRWFDGAIYFKTRLTNSDLSKGSMRVGLHVETSMRAHGINRIKFDERLLNDCASPLREWQYVVKPMHHQKPFHKVIPLNRETVVANLFLEFERMQLIGLTIDRIIDENAEKSIAEY